MRRMQKSAAELRRFASLCAAAVFAAQREAVQLGTNISLMIAASFTQYYLPYFSDDFVYCVKTLKRFSSADL
jgi:hypothetical protein